MLRIRSFWGSDGLLCVALPNKRMPVAVLRCSQHNVMQYEKWHLTRCKTLKDVFIFLLFIFHLCISLTNVLWITCFG